MQKKQILNIINFVRAVEPRVPERDMLLPIKEQIRLMKENNLKGTFLLQYDALVRPEFTDLFINLDPKQFELGLWHEIVQPQVEACGLTWRGRFAWDWHTECGFSVGYTKKERELLVDVSFEKFKEIFGFYPKAFGSWFFDTYTARYIESKYQVDAFCNCKEQFGTDGYTLWGSYYGQGYYPSKNNVFLPAGNKDNQINIPLFRMLGSDPVYQYDYKLDISRDKPRNQDVISLEAVYQDSGKNPDWVKWYMKENFNGDCLSFGYAQAGQENAFGWERMGEGITLQFPYFAKLEKEGKIEIMQLGETGRWYKEQYSETPPSAITAHTAYDDENKSSIWYCTKHFRVNLFADDGAFRIRDIHIMSDNIADPFENTVCTEHCASYETLPFTDGSRYSGKGILAGGFLTYCDGTIPVFDKMLFKDDGNGCATVCYGNLTISLSEWGIKITGEKPFVLENRIGLDNAHIPDIIKLESKTLQLNYLGVDYKIELKQGTFKSEKEMLSSENVLEFNFKQGE